jgi:hypothetical protein
VVSAPFRRSVNPRAFSAIKRQFLAIHGKKVLPEKLA